MKEELQKKYLKNGVETAKLYAKSMKVEENIKYGQFFNKQYVRNAASIAR